MSENSDMDFFEPDQGTNVWTDCMVITKDCENTELAHQFINFLCDADNAYINTQYVGYSSAVQPAYELMRDDDYAGINAYVPRTGYEQDEVFTYQSNEIREIYSELWTRIKAY